MSDLLPFIISGIAIGAVYGLAGTGLVLTYKTSGIFNFGHGALATVAAYLFYALHVSLGLGWEVSAAVTVLAAGPLLGLVMEFLARRLAPQQVAMKIVGTVGLILLVQGIGSLMYGPDPINVDDFLPKAAKSFAAAGVNVQYKYVIITAVTLLVVAALYGLFRFTRAGIAMRAVVDDPDLLAIKGTNPARVRRGAWAIGSTLAALSGVLVLPMVGLEPISLTFLIVVAFGAAAIGGFTSIPLTFTGGILLGIGSDIIKPYAVEVSWLAGLPSALPFIALFAVLLLLPRRRLLPPSRLEHRPPLQWQAPDRVRILTAGIVVIPFLLIPLFTGDKLPFFTVGLSQIIVFLSLGLLVRTSGQVSLCHSIFAAIGAVAFSQFAVDHHVPWLLALLLAGLVAVPVGALVALPAIRLSGLFLALATFGFAIMVERLLYPLNVMFTPLEQGRAMPRPSFAQNDTQYYYLTLIFVIITAIMIEAIIRGRLGRMLRGIAESPVAVSTAGLSINLTKVIVFCASAFLAAIAGTLYGSSVHAAATTDVHYTSFFSVTLLAMLAIAPFTSPWNAIFIGMTAVIPAYLPGSATTYIMNALFGLFAIQTAMTGGTTPMPHRWRPFFEHLTRPHTNNTRADGPDSTSTDSDSGRADSDRADSDVPAPAPPRADERPCAEGGLNIQGLTVRFGGLTAVNDLTIKAPLGRITALIGPNGSGKTTTFNSCTGLNHPDTGQITLHGRDLTKLSPAARGRAGLGRTFQIMELCESLTVTDNIALGHESGLAGAGILSQLAASPTGRQATHTAAQSAMELCGITHLAGHQAGALSTGHRRLVELARCLAGPFDLLLLDEPSSGLDHTETTAFATVIRRVVAERGIGILLVEHDMSLVMHLCDYIYVLDSGTLLSEGDPDDIRTDQRVRAAYLGTNHDTTETQEAT